MTTILCHAIQFNSLRPRDACMRQWTIPSVVQILACAYSTTKPYLNKIILINKKCNTHHTENLKILSAKSWVFDSAWMCKISTALCLICSSVESPLCAIDLRHAMAFARVLNWTNHHIYLRWQNKDDSCYWKNHIGEMQRIFVLQCPQTY